MFSKKYLLVVCVFGAGIALSGCSLFDQKQEPVVQEAKWMVNKVQLKDTFRAGRHYFEGGVVAPDSCKEVSVMTRTSEADKDIINVSLQSRNKANCIQTGPVSLPVAFDAVGSSAAKAVMTFDGQPVQVTIDRVPDEVVVTEPAAGDIVSGVLTVRGTAKGSWFFEGTFPIALIDQLGQEIATGVAQADGEWMTETAVPFTAHIDVPADATGEGQLVLKKDNPSGKPENDDLFSVRVRFASAPIALDVPFLLEKGQSQSLETATVIFDGVEKDSRCPIGTKCVQAGSVTAKFRDIRATVSKTKKFTLTLPDDVKTTVNTDYTIELLDVMPKPGEPTIGRTERALVKISKK